MTESKGTTKVVTRELVMMDGACIGVLFKVAGVGQLELELAKLSAEVRESAMVHGLLQRIGDAAALSRDTKSGKSASPEEKFKAMQALVEHYNSGATSWTLSGGARRPSDEVRLLIEALCEAYPGKPESELRAWVGKRSKGDIAALSQEARLKAIIDRKREERAKGVDVGGLLSELSEEEKGPGA